VRDVERMFGECVAQGVNLVESSLGVDYLHSLMGHPLFPPRSIMFADISIYDNETVEVVESFWFIRLNIAVISLIRIYIYLVPDV
jgi:hypothetical protein